MADSIQLQILKALCTHIAGVNPTNGYEFDLTDAVFRGRLLFGEKDPDTMVSVVEHLQGDIISDTAGYNEDHRTETWVLLVQGIAKNDVNHPTDALYNLKASVEHRLARVILTDRRGNAAFPSEYFLGLKQLNTITGLSIGPGIVSPPRQGIADKAFFYLPVGIGLATDISNPFGV